LVGLTVIQALLEHTQCLPLATMSDRTA